MQPDQRFSPPRCGQLPSSTACCGACCAIYCCRGRSKGRPLPQTHRESGECRVKHRPPSREKPLWPAAHNAAVAWLIDNGYPAPGDGNQAELERYVTDWFENRGHGASEPTIRRHVVRWIKECHDELNAWVHWRSLLRRWFRQPGLYVSDDRPDIVFLQCGLEGGHGATELRAALGDRSAPLFVPRRGRRGRGCECCSSVTARCPNRARRHCFSLPERRRGSAGIEARGMPSARGTVRSAKAISCRRRVGRSADETASRTLARLNCGMGWPREGDWFDMKCLLMTRVVPSPISL
jgi:hypothetical protein